MTHPIGFSTGAIALDDFRRAIAILRSSGARADAIELSALREGELPRLLDALPELDLSAWRYVSIHAPSRYATADGEREAAARLAEVAARWQLPVVVHPDAIGAPAAWSRLGKYLLLENMDLRKGDGQTAAEVAALFERFPEAGFCFDLGHALQVDPSGVEARRMLADHGHRLREVHLSYVNAESKHEPVSMALLADFQRYLPYVPDDAAIILEGLCVNRPDEVPNEVRLARQAVAAAG